MGTQEPLSETCHFAVEESFFLKGQVTFPKLLAEPKMHLRFPFPQFSAHCAVWYSLILLVSAGSLGIQVPLVIASTKWSCSCKYY